MAWQNMLAQMPVIGGDLIQIDQLKRQNAQDERRNQLADIAMQRGEQQYQQGQQDRLTAAQRAQAQEAYRKAEWAIGKPKALIEQSIPEVVQNFERQNGPGSWAQADDNMVQQTIQGAMMRLGPAAGVSPQSAQQQTAEPASVREFQFAQQNPEFAKWQQGQRPPRAPGTLYKVQTPEGPRYMGPEQAQGLAPAEDGPPVQTPKSAMQLRKEFEGQPEVKDFKVILPQLVSARKAPDTGAGDLQIVYTVAKLLDPQSVVRESETAMVLQSVNPISRIVGAGRFNFEGKGRLEPKVRAQLLSMLNERALATRQQYDAARKNFDEYAQQSGFDRQWVTGTHPAASIDPSARLGAAPARQEAPPSAVEFLRKNPQTKAAFKAKYGYLP